MKRVLVTGGTGFVGANLTRRLLREGHEVHLLVRPGYAVWRLEAISAAVRLHEVELNHPAALREAVGRIKPDWIFHLAAHGAYPSQTDVERMVQTNLGGTMNLVEACLATGFEAFIHTGSSSEYGFKDHAPAETDWLEPNSHYAVTKAAATHYCRYTGQSRRAPITTLRLYSVYGPYEEPTRLLPTLIRNGLRGVWPPLVDPATARDFVYVDDVCDACLLTAATAGREPGAVYNVGTGTQTTLAEVAAAARRVLPLTSPPVWGSMAQRVWDTAVWVADNRKLRALGWRPRHDFESGFRAMVEWWAGHAEAGSDAP